MSGQWMVAAGKERTKIFPCTYHQARKKRRETEGQEEPATHRIQKRYPHGEGSPVPAQREGVGTGMSPPSEGPPGPDAGGHHTTHAHSDSYQQHLFPSFCGVPTITATFASGRRSSAHLLSGDVVPDRATTQLYTIQYNVVVQGSDGEGI